MIGGRWLQLRRGSGGYKNNSNNNNNSKNDLLIQGKRKTGVHRHHSADYDVGSSSGEECRTGTRNPHRSLLRRHASADDDGCNDTNASNDSDRRVRRKRRQRLRRNATLDDDINKDATTTTPPTICWKRNSDRTAPTETEISAAVAVGVRRHKSHDDLMDLVHVRNATATSTTYKNNDTEPASPSSTSNNEPLTFPAKQQQQQQQQRTRGGLRSLRRHRSHDDGTEMMTMDDKDDKSIENYDDDDDDDGTGDPIVVKKVVVQQHHQQSLAPSRSSSGDDSLTKNKNLSPCRRTLRRHKSNDDTLLDDNDMNATPLPSTPTTTNRKKTGGLRRHQSYDDSLMDTIVQSEQQVEAVLQQRSSQNNNNNSGQRQGKHTSSSSIGGGFAFFHRASPSKDKNKKKKRNSLGFPVVDPPKRRPSIQPGDVVVDLDGSAHHHQHQHKAATTTTGDRQPLPPSRRSSNSLDMESVDFNNDDQELPTDTNNYSPSRMTTTTRTTTSTPRKPIKMKKPKETTFLTYMKSWLIDLDDVVTGDHSETVRGAGADFTNYGGSDPTEFNNSQKWQDEVLPIDNMLEKINKDFTLVMLKFVTRKVPKMDGHLQALQHVVDEYATLILHVRDRHPRLDSDGSLEQGIYNVVESFVQPKIVYFYEGRLLLNKNSNKNIKSTADANALQSQNLPVGDVAKLITWMEAFFQTIQELNDVNASPTAFLKEPITVAPAWKKDKDNLVDNYLEYGVRIPIRRSLDYTKNLNSLDDNNDDIRTNKDGLMVSGRAEDVIYMVDNELSVTKTVLPPQYSQIVLGACNQLIGNAMTDATLCVGANWQTLEPARLCCLINDTQRLCERLEERNEEVLLDEEYRTMGETAERDLAEFAMQCTFYLCKRIMADLSDTESDDLLLTSVGSAAWETNAQRVAERTVATLQDYLTDLEAWLDPTYYYPKLLKKCFDLTLKTYVESFFANVMEHRVLDPRQVARQLKLDHERFVEFFNGPLLENVCGKAGFYDSQQMNVLLHMIDAMSHIIDPDVYPPADLELHIEMVMTQLQNPDVGAAAVFVLAALRCSPTAAGEQQQQLSNDETMAWLNAIVQAQKAIRKAKQEQILQQVEDIRNDNNEGNDDDDDDCSESEDHFESPTPTPVKPTTATKKADHPLMASTTLFYHLPDIRNSPFLQSVRLDKETYQRDLSLSSRQLLGTTGDLLTSSSASTIGTSNKNFGLRLDGNLIGYLVDKAYEFSHEQDLLRGTSDNSKKMQPKEKDDSPKGASPTQQPKLRHKLYAYVAGTPVLGPDGEEQPPPQRLRDIIYSSYASSSTSTTATKSTGQDLKSTATQEQQQQQPKRLRDIFHSYTTSTTEQQQQEKQHEQDEGAAKPQRLRDRLYAAVATPSLSSSASLPSPVAEDNDSLQEQQEQQSSSGEQEPKQRLRHRLYAAYAGSSSETTTTTATTAKPQNAVSLEQQEQGQSEKPQRLRDRIFAVYTSSSNKQDQQKVGERQEQENLLTHKNQHTEKPVRLRDRLYAYAFDPSSRSGGGSSRSTNTAASNSLWGICKKTGLCEKTSLCERLYPFHSDDSSSNSSTDFDRFEI